jgi:branched-chain amino acid aminotransferase
MNPEGFYNYNGKLYKNDKTIISPNNRSFRYGDGCFETMKVFKDKIFLEAYHLERLFTSLQTLQFNKPNYFITHEFIEQIFEVIKKNKLKNFARVRVTIARGNGGLFDLEDNTPNYVIQAWDMNGANNKLNDEGLIVDVYEEARKACDKFSNLKSNNFLPHIMASLFATEKELNDVLIFNSNDNICESTIANVFIVENDIIKTPALTEGCVNGTMRKFLLKKMKNAKMNVVETSIAVDDLKTASEVFLTNAIQGIRWVKEIKGKMYNNTMATLLHNQFIAPLHTLQDETTH